MILLKFRTFVINSILGGNHSESAKKQKNACPTDHFRRERNVGHILARRKITSVFMTNQGASGFTRSLIQCFADALLHSTHEIANSGLHARLYRIGATPRITFLTALRVLISTNKKLKSSGRRNLAVQCRRQFLSVNVFAGKNAHDIPVSCSSFCCRHQGCCPCTFHHQPRTRQLLYASHYFLKNSGRTGRMTIGLFSCSNVLIFTFCQASAYTCAIRHVR